MCTLESCLHLRGCIVGPPFPPLLIGSRRVVKTRNLDLGRGLMEDLQNVLDVSADLNLEVALLGV